MADNATSLATFIFAAMAGIGSLIRVYQNERFYPWNKRIHKKRQSNTPGE
jgi:hypothetical protein